MYARLHVRIAQVPSKGYFAQVGVAMNGQGAYEPLVHFEDLMNINTISILTILNEIHIDNHIHVDINILT